MRVMVIAIAVNTIETVPKRYVREAGEIRDWRKNRDDPDYSPVKNN